MIQHNYSGWPGAYCLVCGQEDPLELALTCNKCYLPTGPEDEDQEIRLCDVHKALAKISCPVSK